MSDVSFRAYYLGDLVADHPYLLREVIRDLGIYIYIYGTNCNTAAK